MTEKAHAQQTEINETKHTEFSKLTVIKGLKDEPNTQISMITIREKATQKQQSWIMPEERTGYIKCRDYDFL